MDSAKTREARLGLVEIAEAGQKSAAMDLIELRDIQKTYHLGEVDLPVLKGISLNIARGELVALMGASGSGKSTLMNIIGCLDRPTSGEYWIDGHQVSWTTAKDRARLRRRMIGFVFQNFNLLGRTTALENVLMPLTYTREDLSKSQMNQRAVELLRKVGLADRIDHQSTQLSGGEQQRVAIARALINHPQVLLADEPTGNLDSRTSQDILRMFQQLNGSEGLTIVLVTHDADVAQHTQRIIYHQGRPHRDMKSYRTLKTAFGALRRNVMRAVLTTLGIIIGVAAVITMMEIGNGASIAIQRTMASMGANTLVIFPAAASIAGVNQGAGSMMTLTPQDADTIAKNARQSATWPRLSEPAPRWSTVIVIGSRLISTARRRPIYRSANGPIWTRVKPFTEHEVLNASKVCLIGQTIVNELFGGQSPVGKEVRIRNVAFRVIGVLQKKGANVMGMDQDDILLAPVDDDQISGGGFLIDRRQSEQHDHDHQHGQYA